MSEDTLPKKEKVDYGEIAGKIKERVDVLAKRIRFWDATVSIFGPDLLEELAVLSVQLDEAHATVSAMNERLKMLEARLSEFDKYILEKRILPLENRVAALEPRGK